MPFTLSLIPSGNYIDNTLKGFGESLELLINVASQVNKLEVTNLKFVCGRRFEEEDVVDIKMIISHKIPYLDALIYISLSEENKKLVHWEVDDSRQEYTEAQITYSALFIYFMLVTRNKAIPERGENIPLFLTKFMSSHMTIEDIKKCLSENNLNLFNHEWIKDVRITNLSSAIKNRFKQGIAGMRLFTAIRDNEPNKNIDSNLKNLVSRIRELLQSGPFWEMHTLFQTPYLSSQSISANLNNLLLDLYTHEKLKEMEENNTIFKYPIFNPRAVQYKTWGDSFFSEYKTKIQFD